VAAVLAEQAAIAVTAALRHYDEVTLSDHLRTALSSRSVIDQAIGIIMGQRRCTADEAFAMLRTISQRRNLKLRVVAADLVASTIGRVLSPVRACAMDELRNEGTTVHNLDGRRTAATQLQVDVSLDPPRCTVRLGGELDMATAAQLRGALQPVCESRHRPVVIDLGELRFLGLCGLHVLVEAHQALLESGCGLVLARPDALTMRVLALTRLDQILPVVPEAEHVRPEVALGSGPAVSR
jgi:anti-anti-sigma factor